MELLLFVGLVVVLDVLALRFGHDSRDDLWTDDRRREWESRTAAR